MNFSDIMRVILTGIVFFIYHTKTMFVEAVCPSTTTISTASIRNGK